MSTNATNHPFDTDPSGNIVTYPLIGYASAPAAQSAIIARFEYARTPTELREITAGNTRPIALQLAITPQQALELAERLQALARHVLEQTTPPKTSQS